MAGVKLSRLLFVLLLMFLTITAPAAASVGTQRGARYESAPNQAPATVLVGIEIERTAAETKVFLKADGVIKEYREVRLKKNIDADRPERMYLDIKNVRLKGPLPVIAVGTALAKVRTGPRPDGVRVVFDSSLGELFNYSISSQPDGLLVTIREPAADAGGTATIQPAQASGTEPEKNMELGVVSIQPEPKGAGDLDLLIVPSALPEQTQEWLDSPPTRKISLQILRTAKPDQEITTSFLVTGVTPDSSGDYVVEVSFTLLDPAGKPMYNKRRFAKTTGLAPATPAFILAEPGLDLILDESDPAGEYLIIGIVEDLTSNKIARSSSPITLEKGRE